MTVGSRRGAAVGAAAIALAAGTPAAGAATLTPVGDAISAPVWVGSPPGGGGLFAVDQPGRVLRLVRGHWRTFLDLRGQVKYGGEQGLLSIAFHPRYRGNRFLYAYWNAPRAAGGSTITIARFTANRAGTSARASTEHVILRIAHPVNENHNGGQLQFGPDGLLWVGTGDGGSGGDPPNNAQRSTVLLGKMLRIDVNHGSAGRRYRIPATNPFARSHSRARKEIWALGVRNPWRFSFDRATGDLWIGDVGQDQWEEVDLVRHAVLNRQRPVRNFGWHRYEGTHPYTGSTSTAGLTMPIYEYAHNGGGAAITGGYVYRGRRIGALAGAYLFSDSSQTSSIWALRQSGGSWVRSTVADVPGGAVAAFGEDGSGNVYAASLGSGRIYRLDP